MILIYVIYLIFIRGCRPLFFNLKKKIMKIRFSMFMTSAVGKAGGQFIQRYNGGYMLRNITMPVQRFASVSNPQRTLNSRVFSMWQTFSAETQSEWSVVGANLRTKNPWGEDVILTGRQAFTMANALTLPFTNIIVSPYTFDYITPSSDITNVNINSADDVLVIDLNNANNVLFYQLKGMILKNYSQNPNVSKLKTFARLATVDDASANFEAFLNGFPNFRTGYWFMFSVRGVSASGLVSPWQLFKIRIN